LDCEGRTIWIADAHRDDGKRFIVHADEILTRHRAEEQIKRAQLEQIRSVRWLLVDKSLWRGDP